MYRDKFTLLFILLAVYVYSIYGQEEPESTVPPPPASAPGASASATLANPLDEWQSRINEWRQQADDWRKQAQDWGKLAAENAQSFVSRFISGNGTAAPPT